MYCKVIHISDVLNVQGNKIFPDIVYGTVQRKSYQSCPPIAKPPETSWRIWRHFPKYILTIETNGYVLTPLGKWLNVPRNTVYESVINDAFTKVYRWEETQWIEYNFKNRHTLTPYGNHSPSSPKDHYPIQTWTNDHQTKIIFNQNSYIPRPNQSHPNRPQQSMMFPLLQGIFPIPSHIKNKMKNVKTLYCACDGSYKSNDASYGIYL